MIFTKSVPIEAIHPGNRTSRLPEGVRGSMTDDIHVAHHTRMRNPRRQIEITIEILRRGG